MIRLAFLLLCVLAAPCSAATPPYSDFGSPDTMLVVGRLEALVRSDDPLSVAKGDRIVTSNGCGYDTAVIRVIKKVDAQNYRQSEVAAHLELGEFCSSFLQDQVKDYLLALRWNGTVWEIDAGLSSRLLPDSSGELWLVEPELVDLIEDHGLKARNVEFSSRFLEDLAIGIEKRRGATPEPGVSRQGWLEELHRLKPVPGEWPSNPLYFHKGISLADFLAWLAASNPPVPKLLRDRS